MGIAESRPCTFRAELGALTARARASADRRVRRDLFEALARLERRALVGGAADRTLRDIAEARFLAGILRDAVRPPRPASLRTVLRARGTERPPAEADGAQA